MHIKFILYFKEKSSIIVCVSVTRHINNISVFIRQYFKPSFMLNDFLFSVINWFAETIIFMS